MRKQIIKENEDCDAEYFLCSWYDINSMPKHRMVIYAKDICELMEEYHKQKLMARKLCHRYATKRNEDS